MTPEKTRLTVGDENTLVQEILADARAKAERTSKRAEREVGEILQDAAKQEAEEIAKIVKAAEERAEREKQRVLRTTAQEIKRRHLAAREQALDALFEAALQRLRDKKSYDYRGSVVALAATAIGAMAGESFELRFAAADADFAKPEFLSQVQAAVRAAFQRSVQLKASANAPKMTGGVIVEAVHEMFDNSFESRVRRLRPQLRNELGRILFGIKTQE